MNISALLQKAQKLELEYNHAKRQVLEELEAVDEAQVKVETAEEGQRVVQEVALAVQEKVHARVASIVSRCLAAVFDDPYEFRLDFTKKRGKTEARLVFTRNGLELDPMDAAGGGVLDVAALGLRLAALVLTRPQPRRLLVLDEACRMLSKEYVERFGTLLETLAVDFGVQILLVTHNRGLQRIGKVVEIE